MNFGWKINKMFQGRKCDFPCFIDFVCSAVVQLKWFFWFSICTGASPQFWQFHLLVFCVFSYRQKDGKINLLNSLKYPKIILQKGLKAFGFCDFFSAYRIISKYLIFIY